MPFFINPGRRKRRKGRKLPKRGKRGRFVKAIKAPKRRTRRVKPMARRRRRRLPRRTARGRFVKGGSATTKRRRTRSRSRRRAYASNPPRRRRRRSHAVAVHRRRRYRRNPFSGGSIMRQLVNDLQGGAGVLVGEIAGNKLAAVLPDNIIPPGSYQEIAAQAALPQILRYVLKRFAKLHGPILDGIAYGGTALALRRALEKVSPETAAKLLADYPYDGAALAAYGTGAAAALPPAGGGSTREHQFMVGAYGNGLY